ncbi:MAG: IPT/TIG domain-containing protein [Terracidiphilus sp.]
MLSTRWYKRRFSVFLLIALACIWAQRLMAADSSITSLSPSAAIAGGADLTLTIEGANFTSASIVLWGGEALETSYKSEAELTAVIPASLTARAGVFDVTVRTEGADAGSVEFTVDAQPAVTDLLSTARHVAIDPIHAAAGTQAGALTALPTSPLTAESMPHSTAISTPVSSATSSGSSIPSEPILPSNENSSTNSISTKTTIVGSSSFNFSLSVGPPPTFASLSPTLAFAGGFDFTLTITGTNFTSTSTVMWGSVALATNFVSATQLTATVPASLIGNNGTASISVSDIGGSSSASAFNLLKPPPPAITSLSPTIVLAGGADFTLTIYGRNFTATSAALWNGSALTTTSLSPTQLTAAVPASLIASPGTASITVSTVGGVSPGASLIVNPPAPVLTSLSPSLAVAGSAAFTMTINGLNFTSSSTVNWGSKVLATNYKNATQLTVTVPAALIASAGTASITVSNVTGTSPGASFTINPPPPTITSLNPASTVAGGADLQLTVSGTNFDVASIVSWGSTPLATILVSATQLTATIPAALMANPGTGSVTVSTDGGVSSAATFNLIPQTPTISSLSPPIAIAGGAAFTLTISGTNFTSTSSTMWNKTKLSTTYVSSTQLIAAVPSSLIAAVSTASITVSTTGGVTPATTFTINPQAPTITSLSPAKALVGGGAFTLTVTGTNFTSSSTVTFAGTQLAATYVSVTQMTATVPATLIASVGTAIVTVSNVTGSSLAANFTVVQPQPTITSLSPASTVAGGADLLLTVNGTNFDAASIVSWGSTPLATTLLSATQLTATVPAALTANPGTGSVTVSTDGGTTSAAVFTIIPQQPTISSLIPSTAVTGGATFTLTITGVNFTSTSATMWNTTKLTTTYVSATQLTAAVPANLITAVCTPSITVSTTGGVTPGVIFSVNPPTPTLTSLNPAKALAGGGAFTLAISGTNFTSSSTVTFAGTQLAATYSSATQMTATVPAALIASVGTARVAVSNVTGTSSGANFTVVQPPPTLTSLSPASTVAGGADLLLTVNGTNFDAASIVFWGSTPLATILVSATQLTATLPAALTANPGTGSITVSTDGGVSSASVFNLIPQTPTISSLSPSIAIAGGAAFTLTISGTNFTSTSTTMWNTTKLTTTYVSATQLTAAVPASLITAVSAASITVSTTGGVSPAATFTVNPPAPKITSLNPSMVMVGGNDLMLTLNGTNFTSSSTVTFAGTVLAATYVSATQLTATVPAALTGSAGAASVSVSNVSGASTAATFTINPPPPTIYNFSPTYAVAGGAAFTLNIYGTNYTANSTAKWNTTALATTYVSSTQVTVAVPASLITIASAPSITISNVSGASPSAAFTVNPPVPTITSLSPASAYSGGAAITLTVNGTNFTSTWTLFWNSTELPSTFISSTRLTATVPASLIASAGTARITVSNVTGTSAGANFTIIQPPPAITSLSPASMAAGGPDLLMTINGANFDAASAASWGSIALTTTLISTTQLTVTVPAALTANPGTGSIAVSTNGGTSGNTVFTIVPQPPMITSISPSSAVAGGAAFTLTLTGTNFNSTAMALWNTSKLTTTYISATQLTAAVPASLITTASTPSVTVSTTGGVSPAAAFTINPTTPTITSLNPSTAIAGNVSYTLTISGTNFNATSTVQCNSSALATTFVNTSQLTAVVPANLYAVAGTASVTVSNMTGTSSSATITILPPLPTISSLTPNTVQSNNGTFTMTVNGANFQPGVGATLVKWNYSALATTYVSSTQVIATVPASLLPYGSVSVYVVTASGVSSGFPFTVNLPAPIILSMGMYEVPAGFGSFTLRIFGTYFTSAMVLNWGSTQLSGTLVGSVTFTVIIPANLVASTGNVNLTVTTTGGTSAPITFQIQQPNPTITSLSPSSVAVGSSTFTLTVNGTNFVSGMNILFGSTWVGANVISSTQATTTIPTYLLVSAGTVGIIAYASHNVSPFAPFTITAAPPIITSLGSYSCTAGSAGFMLMITGIAFTTTSTAMWGTTPLDTIYENPALITAVIPASLIINSGTASISVVSAAGTSASATFLITPAPPAISGLSPGVVVAGGPAFTLTINGAYFTPSTTSTWGSTALTTTYISATQLTAAVPAKLIATTGTASITVTTAIGTSPPATFTISGPPRITTATLPSATAGQAYSGSISVIGGTPGYAWTVTGLPSSFSYFNTSGSTLTITGTPATTGPVSFRVSAQDNAGATAGPVTLSFNVAAGPNGVNNGRLSGSYTCLLQGSIDDDGTRWASLLNFQADGQGNFNNGIFDINSYDIGSASGIERGSYVIGADDNGTATIHTILTNNAAGVQTTQWAIALSGSAQPAAEFRMVEADDLGTWPSGQQGTASCYLANPSAFASNSVDGLSFAYGLDGEDNNSNVKATAGQFSTSNGAITGYLDTTLGGSATDQATSFTGNYSEPDPDTGRFTIALHGAGNSTGYTVYMIDANRMFILDNTSDDGEQAGSLRAQQPAATTSAALSGPFVLYNRGAQFNANSGIPTSFYANLLLGAGDGAGYLTINQSYVNAAGAYAAGGSISGAIALAFDPANPGRASFPTASGTSYLYFYDANNAFEMSVGYNGSVDSGRLEAQTQSTFKNTALTGSYLFGEQPLLSVQPTAYLGEYTLASSSAITAGFTTSAQGILSWDQALSTTYAWDATVPGAGGFFINNGAQGKASCASISATRFACIPQTDPAPSAQIMQQ